jgi:chromosome segregation ATPase
MDEGLHRVNRTCTTGQRLINLVDPEGQKAIQNEVDTVKKEWDAINSSLNETCVQLEGQLTQWDIYYERTRAFELWLDEVESELSYGTDPKAELMEMKSQLEKFRMLSSRIANKEPEFSALKSAVQELAPQCDEPLEEDYENLRHRFAKAGQDACNAVLNLEEACDSQRLYREALHENEKWILQASYRLMAHNALDVSSPELTAQQIAKHEVYSS